MKKKKKRVNSAKIIEEYIIYSNIKIFNFDLKHILLLLCFMNY